MTVKYVSMGIILDDIVFPDGRTQMAVLGGGGAQAAWGMALAAKPGTVGMLSGVGHDFPTAALAPLLAMDIDVSGVHTTDLPTPRAWQLLEEDGQRTHVFRVEQATADLQTHLTAETILRHYPDLEVIQWGIHPEDPFLEPSPSLSSRNVTICIEPFKGLESPASDEELNTALTACDIYSPNWDEAVSLFGTDDKFLLLRRARDLGGYIMALRFGATGSEAWNLHTGEGIAVPAAPVTSVVDPVGAGDAFCGAFAVAWHESQDLEHATVQASVAASFMLEQIGLPLRRPANTVIQQRHNVVRNGVQILSLES